MQGTKPPVNGNYLNKRCLALPGTDENRFCTLRSTRTLQYLDHSPRGSARSNFDCDSIKLFPKSARRRGSMIGTKLSDRYELLGELGRGGMGVVYLARDPRLNREVAVKILPPALLTPASEERFQREAELVARMDHPAIVPIYDIGQHEGSFYFVMPVVRGTNLRQFLREGPRSLGEIIEIVTQVADALDYSHGRGIIHRDVKPENIMVTQEEGSLRARVMDFGLAKAASEHNLTKTGTLIGTVLYLSPEQVTARDLDGRSDIYSLGTVLY